jgi:PIN domain nuclease of toxin-antitoxin system
MDRLLLDTCVLLWWRTDSPKLTPVARRAIYDASEVFVSAASAWEISIKVGIGKLPATDLVSMTPSALGFIELPITIVHGELAGALPLHHKDPFDRMLIAQARHEGLLLVTQDRAFHAYGITVLWV